MKIDLKELARKQFEQATSMKSTNDMEYEESHPSVGSIMESMKNGDMKMLHKSLSDFVHHVVSTKKPKEIE